MRLDLGGDDDLGWAQEMVTKFHYLRQPVDPRARPMVYVLRSKSFSMHRLGLVMVGLPHATKCNGWWGYPGLITQWQVVDLCRIWIDPDVQAGGRCCDAHTVPGFWDRRGQWRPALATWMIAEVLRQVQADRVRLWPPVYPAQPYHIELAISYHDPIHHRGTIYRESRALPMYVDRDGAPRPGPAGKFGWAWRLARPGWEWPELEGIRSRTLRMF